MSINITLRSAAITPPMKDYALEKAEKLQRYFDNLQKIDITLDAEKERKIAEIIALAPGNKLVAKEEQDDIHMAIDFAIDKIEAQIVRMKSKLRDHHHKKNREILGPSDVTPEEEEKEETYQEIVDKIDFEKQAKELKKAEEMKKAKEKGCKKETTKKACKPEKTPTKTMAKKESTTKDPSSKSSKEKSSQKKNKK